MTSENVITQIGRINNRFGPPHIYDGRLFREERRQGDLLGKSQINTCQAQMVASLWFVQVDIGI